MFVPLPGVRAATVAPCPCSVNRLGCARQPGTRGSNESRRTRNVGRAEHRGRGREVTLNRPEKLNALTMEMRQQLREHFAALRFNDASARDHGDRRGTRVLHRCRCRAHAARRVAVGARKDAGRQPQFLRTLHAIEKPVIAAVRGPTVGIGWSIALACDLIVASETARFSQIFRRIGLAPDGGAIWFLTRRIGLARAKELVFTARFVEAAEALSLGLVNYVVPDGELMAKTQELAADLASGTDVCFRDGEEAVPHGKRAELRRFPGLRGVRAAAVGSDGGPPRGGRGVPREAEADVCGEVMRGNLSRAARERSRCAAPRVRVIGSARKQVERGDPITLTLAASRSRPLPLSRERLPRAKRGRGERHPSSSSRSASPPRLARSFPSAFASIWRMRSRVTLNRRPTSSSV